MNFCPNSKIFWLKLLQWLQSSILSTKSKPQTQLDSRKMSLFCHFMKLFTPDENWPKMFLLILCLTRQTSKFLSFSQDLFIGTLILKSRNLKNNIYSKSKHDENWLFSGMMRQLSCTHPVQPESQKVWFWPTRICLRLWPPYLELCTWTWNRTMFIWHFCHLLMFWNCFVNAQC